MIGRRIQGFGVSLAHGFSNKVVPPNMFYGTDKKYKNDKKDSVFYRIKRLVLLTGPIENVITKSGISDDPILTGTIARTIAIGSHLLIMSSVLGTLGFDTKPFVAGLGVTGFTVGFALKDVATNYLSGLLLVLNRPFKQGWRVRLFNGSTSFEGIVKAVDTRYVHLELKDKHRILLPSYVVYSNPIVVLESSSMGDDDKKEKSKENEK